MFFRISEDISLQKEYFFLKTFFREFFFFQSNPFFKKNFYFHDNFLSGKIYSLVNIFPGKFV